jgi:hypothetical protein
VIVRDDLPNHWRESYVRETGKSMNARRLPTSRLGRTQAFFD